MTLHTGKTIDTIDASTILDCESCGFTHVMPLPSEEELKKFYTKAFYDSEKPDYFKYAEEDLEWWLLTYNHYYDLIEAHAPGTRLLDIGSGPGYFLDAGKARGWDVLGFEPSSAAADYSSKRGLTVINDVFTYEKAKQHGTFDVVMLSLVLEHIPDPAHLLEEAKKMLAPEGLLTVVVPNDYNPLQKLLRSQKGFSPWWVAPTHHLNYFSVESITALITSLGFSVAELETSYPMEFFLLSGRNYVGHPEVGRACHAERKAFETALFQANPKLLSALYHGWAQEGIGREVVVIAKKQA